MTARTFRFARLRQTAGATLIEVMVALGILATAYVALLETQSGSVRLSTFGKEITVATFLAELKLEETEEKLLKDGFPQSEESSDGKFDDQGYPGYRWDMVVKPVELPIGAAFEQLMSNWGKTDEDPESGGGGLDGMLGKIGGSQGVPSQLTDLVKGAKGGGGIASMLNPEMLQSNAQMLADTIEQSIREVTLTVSWAEGGPGYELKVTTHLVNVPQAPGEAGANPQLANPAPGQFPGGFNPVTNPIMKNQFNQKGLNTFRTATQPFYNQGVQKR